MVLAQGTSSHREPWRTKQYFLIVAPSIYPPPSLLDEESRRMSCSVAGASLTKQILVVVLQSGTACMSPVCPFISNTHLESHWAAPKCMGIDNTASFLPFSCVAQFLHSRHSPSPATELT